MHLAIAVCSIIAAGIWADWRNWKNYYPTLLYVLAVSMLYEFLTKEHTIWKFRPDFFMNHSYIVLIHAIITVPFAVFIFLSRYPTTWGKRILHYLLWIGFFICVEWIMQITKRIGYENKWSLSWSLIFDIIMFPMLRLHHKNPLLALILSIPIIVAYLWIFKVPVR